MFCSIKLKNNDYQCYYETYGSKDKEPLVLLHGWGVDSSIFSNIISQLDYYVVVLDFLGFGKSDTPLIPLTLEDYVNQVAQVMEKLNLKNITMLGHSFGGRIAIKYNYYYNLSNLILVDSAGIKKFNYKLRKKIIKYKLLKKYYYIFSKKKYQKLVETSGSRDYKILSPIMKQTMNKVINVDLRKYCKKTRTKTLILWGVNDQETPLQDGYIFYKCFYRSRIILFYKSGHFPSLDEKDKFIRIINGVKDD
jgi:pimeloyl-ACP methyl ester carboxylesterase